MANISFNNIREGMNVCDSDGNKIGTVNMVHQLGRTVGAGLPQSTSEGYVQIDTGFLGLGKDLYIPLNAIRNCTSDCCFLNVNKDAVNRMGWDQKPTTI